MLQCLLLEMIKRSGVGLVHIIEQLYGPFFDLSNWIKVVDSGSDWAIIFSLILIECLLSVDNAVVLAAQTQSLPTLRQQKKALIYGLWGSYLMRFIMIGLGTFLIHIWAVKVIGALYLLYLVGHFFYQRHQKKHTTTQKPKQGSSVLWVVVLQVVMMDAIFSVDSVLAALAISSNPIIVLIGGLVGILVMRGVAELILSFMKRIPELEPMAYYLIAFIAIKLFLSIPQIGIEIPSWLFVIILVIAVVATLLAHQVNSHRKQRSRSEAKKS